MFAHLQIKSSSSLPGQAPRVWEGRPETPSAVGYASGRGTRPAVLPPPQAEQGAQKQPGRAKRAQRKKTASDDELSSGTIPEAYQSGGL